jgi:hypothetical protein
VPGVCSSGVRGGRLGAYHGRVPALHAWGLCSSGVRGLCGIPRASANTEASRPTASAPPMRATAAAAHESPSMGTVATAGTTMSTSPRATARLATACRPCAADHPSRSAAAPGLTTATASANQRCSGSSAGSATEASSWRATPPGGTCEERAGEGAGSTLMPVLVPVDMLVLAEAACSPCRHTVLCTCARSACSVKIHAVPLLCLCLLCVPASGRPHPRACPFARRPSCWHEGVKKSDLYANTFVGFRAPFQCPAKLARGGVNHGSSRARWGDNAPTSASLGGR